LPPEQRFVLFVAAWVALVLGAASLSWRADVAGKRRWHPRLVVASAILLVAFASLIVPPSYLLLVAPAAALIAWMNLRMTKFCDACGASLFNRSLRLPMRFCQVCGASLERVVETPS
jgi:hypothetical protein